MLFSVQALGSILSQNFLDGFQTLFGDVDREEEDFYVGRTQYDSPEVDPEILISKDTPLSPGSFYQVKVIDAQAFDLYGKVLN